MANLDKIDQEITDILLEHLVLANDNGQPYIKSTDTAVEAIKALIATQVREATNKVFVKFNKATLAGENQAKIDELEKLLADDGQCICQLADQEVCDHNWSLCNTVKDRIAELRGNK